MPDGSGKPALAATPLTEFPKRGLIDLFFWKLMPERFGGGIPYIQHLKDAWVQNNKLCILAAAGRYKLPPPLLAGLLDRGRR